MTTSKVRDRKQMLNIQVDFSRGYTRMGSSEYDNFNNENGVFLKLYCPNLSGNEVAVFTYN